jgi:hypothetical protein
MNSEERLYLIIKLSCSSSCHRTLLCSRCGCVNGRDVLITWAQKYFWAHLMALLGDVGQVEAHFILFGDSVNLDAREVHGLRRT